ncbi:MFS transporter [Streptomyces sp. NPDC049881]|uniref:MFS transporter n=1 Tax=Streptomyces sp. NPDC049881 TaxID=3155778 RepID=UPI003417E56A
MVVVRLSAVPVRVPAPSARRLWTALAVVLACQLMTILDVTIVNVAVPRVQADLGFTPAGVSWVINAYTLAFGGLLLLGGRAADILGARRVLLYGVALFAGASLLGGLATTDWWLIAARTAQGVGAACIAPGTLALITVTFPEGRARTRALAVYSAVGAGGGSAGLLLGGTLTDLVSWRWGLLINVPLGIGILLLAPRVVAETATRRGRFDLPGAVTSSAGMAALVLGPIHAVDAGWSDPLTVAALVLGAATLAVFVRIESRAARPLIPLTLFAHRVRSAAYLNLVLLGAALSAMFFLLTQFLQQVRGLDALETGLAFLPMLVPIFAIVQFMPGLLARTSPIRLVVGGAVLINLGVLWLTLLTGSSGYLGSVLGPMLLFGVGGGLSFMPMYQIGLTGVPADSAGAAAGVLQAVQQLGGALGMGVLVTVFGFASRSAGGDLAAGVRAAFAVGAVFTLVALAVAVFAVRAVRPADPAAERAAAD